VPHGILITGYPEMNIPKEKLKIIHHSDAGFVIVICYFRKPKWW
jgi:hypothetical protein